MCNVLRSCGAVQRIFPLLFKGSVNRNSYTKIFVLGYWKQVNYSSWQPYKAKPPEPKKIILYEHDNSDFFTKLKIVSIGQYVMWLLFGFSSYDILAKIFPVLNENDKSEVTEPVVSQKTVNIVFTLTFIFGTILLFVIWMYISRNIRQISLNEQKNVVMFNTYSPIKSLKEFSVPLNHVSGVISRHNAKGYVPLKIKGAFFYYLIDVNGQFCNPYLFDHTVGVKRKF